MPNEYQVVDDFQIKQMRVLVLDRDFNFEGKQNKAVIDGEFFSYVPNSVRKWITIESEKKFKGKVITFI